MADRSKIEWTDASWNPVRAQRIEYLDGDAGEVTHIGWHCTHVSEGCRNCYAEGFNKRLGTGLAYHPDNLFKENRGGFRNGEARIILDEKMLMQPLKWKRPRKIFVGSMTDIFADFVSDEMLDRIFAVAALCPQHTFQFLTKRPARMRVYLTYRAHNLDVGHACGRVAGIVETMRKSGHGMPWNGRGPVGHLEPGASWWPLANVWLGVSCEDQATADTRIPDLLATPAIRFISAEPLLGPLHLGYIGWPNDLDLRREGFNALLGFRYEVGLVAERTSSIDWVICGGESGPHARPMHPDWARSLRDQCAAAGVPFFFKQWGEWADMEDWASELQDSYEIEGKADGNNVRVGKRRAGRLLDGIEHNAFPEVASC